MRRIRTIAAFCLGGLMLLGATALVLDRLFPPDMTRYEDRSQLVLDADGGLLRAFTTQDGMWRLPAEASEVDPNYIAALVAYEDQRFYRHLGVDPIAIVRASWQAVTHGRIVSGASTLTMQTARLLEPRPRTLRSKVIEAFRALQLEARYSKDEILSIYLTLAPYGGNLEGARAASLAYFGKEPAELSIAQAALLVALPQSPERLRPDRNPEAARAARDRVIGVLADRGAVTVAHAGEATEDPFPDARAALPFRVPRLAQQLASTHEGLVQTFIDPALQSQIERISQDADEALEAAADLAIVVVDNETREVIAYSGGADFWGPQGQVNLARASRSPGSALKPFIYGLAFDDLPLHPETLMDDRALSFNGYAPQNFDRDFAGEVTVRMALQASLNVPAVAVLDRVGPARLSSRLEQAGAGLSYGRMGAAPSLPLALGGVGLTLEDLTMLYVALANGGEAAPLRFSSEDELAPAHTRLMSETAAWYIRDILRGAQRPDGRGLTGGQAEVVAYKTGTSYGYRDAWAVGFTSRYTVGVWVGRADGSPRPGSYGRNTAAPILFDVFDHLEGVPVDDPAPADALVVRARNELPPAMQIFVPQETEAQVAAATPRPRIAYPPQGAVLYLREDAPLPVALRATGGTMPLRWMVNGEVLEDAGAFGPTLWQAGEEGFARLSVIDADGRADTVSIRLDTHH